MKTNNIRKINIYDLYDEDEKEPEKTNTKSETSTYSSYNYSNDYKPTYKYNSKKETSKFWLVMSILFLVSVVTFTAFAIIQAVKVVDRSNYLYAFINVDIVLVSIKLSIISFVKAKNASSVKINLVSSVLRFIFISAYSIVAILWLKETILALLAYIIFEIACFAIFFVYYLFADKLKDMKFTVFLSLITFIASFSVAIFAPNELFYILKIYVLVVSILLILATSLAGLLLCCVTDELWELIVSYIFNLITIGFVGFYCFYFEWLYWFFPTIVAVMVGLSVFLTLGSYDDFDDNGLAGLAIGSLILDGILLLGSIAWMIVEYIVF